MRKARLALTAAVVLTASGAAALESGTLTGKVVYLNMGIEEAVVEAVGEGGAVFRSKSSYHGDFILKLPLGSYKLAAMSALTRGNAVFDLSSPPKEVNLTPQRSRIDRLTLELTPN